MTDKYDFVQRDDMVMTSVKFRTIRKHKNYKKGDRFWLKHGWKKLSWHNKIYPFTRWKIEIGDEIIWAKCVSTTNTREVWRFERFKRYRWWSSIAPSWCFFDEWMEQAKLQGGYNAN